MGFGAFDLILGMYYFGFELVDIAVLLFAGVVFIIIDLAGKFLYYFAFFL